MAHPPQRRSRTMGQSEAIDEEPLGDDEARGLHEVSGDKAWALQEVSVTLQGDGISLGQGEAPEVQNTGNGGGAENADNTGTEELKVAKQNELHTANYGLDVAPPSPSQHLCSHCRRPLDLSQKRCRNQRVHPPTYVCRVCNSHHVTLIKQFGTWPLEEFTYLSDEAMRAKFGRDLRAGRINYGFDVEFQVESYLRYQGESFVTRFDANTYLLMTKALDYFDPAYATGGNLAQAFAPATARFMVVSFTSDWSFAPARSKEIVDALVDAGKEVAYAEVESDLGHDDFLLTMPHYVKTLRAYLGRAAAEVGA